MSTSAASAASVELGEPLREPLPSLSLLLSIDDLAESIAAPCGLATLTALAGASRSARAVSRRLIRNSEWAVTHAGSLDSAAWICAHRQPEQRLLPLGSAPAASPWACSGIACAAVSGAWVASGGGDLLCRVWRRGSRLGEPLALQHSDEVSCLALDGSRLASGCRDGTIRLFDLSVAETAAEAAAGATLAHRHSTGEDDGAAVLCLVFPRAGSLLTGGADRRLRLWKTDSGLAAAGAVAVEAATPALAAADGLVVSPAADHSLELRDADSLAFRGALVGHARPVLAVAMAPGRVVSGGGDGRLCVWALRACCGEAGVAGECLYELTSGRGRVPVLALEGDLLLAAGGGTEGVCVWDLAGGRCAARLGRRFGGGTRGSVSALALSGRGAVLGDTQGHTVLIECPPLCS
ncbi:hypothetical protein EMIHUDRAFT_121092 [Emiliania huxleyi CCMP1516]|uniref:Uncharacterized protein n=2 Tax=Emiliania huxleyi TaxID=2903 RepID=A0A0D3I8K9_EMIH1|nr:hypothetical protein EMIHUDRAFT_121092 [Emiliania huxleyi CCMP1516]EOD07594.1 hypothetical protein EMIHUDRAFT_121092 [Emiliania huxleyi CCMP1516]|eukprot:XP_005760023.1 hypothetical protein EMIHUDRAFT_121092 [Emiliania huxleyi CCMP1516]